jgi:hypothetical protein
MMPCTCVICFFLLLVWFVKSWPDREREREREREITGLVDTHAVKALATKTLYHNSACYSLPATGEIRNTIDPRQVNVIVKFQNLPAIMMWNAPIPYGTSICNSISYSRQSV